MQMVADLADRICVLNYGQMLAEGAPQQALRDPRVVEAYRGVTSPGSAAFASR
jgi:ABC-type branched-subunit amino acid transport system ATPase component